MMSYDSISKRSMGGTGSWHFAEKFPDRFSTAIPVAATGWQARRDPLKSAGVLPSPQGDT